MRQVCYVFVIKQSLTIEVKFSVLAFNIVEILFNETSVHTDRTGGSACMRLIFFILCGLLLTACNQYHFSLPKISKGGLSTRAGLTVELGLGSSLVINLAGLRFSDRLYVLKNADASCEGGEDVGFDFVNDSLGTNSLSLSHIKEAGNFRVLVINEGERICSSLLAYTQSSSVSPLVRSARIPAFNEISRDEKNPMPRTLQMPDPLYDVVGGVVVEGQPRLTVASGNAHTCSIMSSGKVMCWGHNGEGQLGDGTFTQSTTPVEVSGIFNAVDIATYEGHNCAILATGRLMCWGNNSAGQLGINSTTNSPIPVEVPGLVDVVQVSTGNSHTCAVMRSGGIKCWGENYGKLGNNSSANSLIPVDVVGITNAVGVHASYNGTCAVLGDGTLRCWGVNYAGELGDGTTNDSLVPVNVNGITNAVSVVYGNSTSCALLRDKTIQCWGSNNGWFGNGTTAPSFSPVLANVTGAIGLYASGYGACALLEDGKINCWGNNDHGQLGHGVAGNSSSPVEVSGISDAIQVSAGTLHICALREGNVLNCWGSNYNGELGDAGGGTTAYAPNKVKLPRTTYVGTVTTPTRSPVIAMGSNHDCLLNNNGTVSCWGYGATEMGLFPITNSTIPEVVPGISSATELSIGHSHACALLVSGSVRCWGDNQYGQLGDSTNTNSATPVTVTGITNAISISSGYWHTCALLDSGEVRCWGSNNNGRLGDGYTTHSNEPLSVVGLTNVIAIRMGLAHSCALLDDGHVNCWGSNNYRQLGSGDNYNFLDSYTPVEVRDITNAIGIAGGANHTCALLSDGKVNCWGNNNYNQTGSNEFEQPVEVAGLSQVVDLVSRKDSTCAILSDRRVFCWGENIFGQLGSQVGYPSMIPLEVPNLTQVREVSMGNTRACALRDNGRITCWGQNNYQSISQPSKRLVSNFDFLDFSLNPTSACMLLQNKTVQCSGRGDALGISVPDPSEIYLLNETTPISGVSDIKKLVSINGAHCGLREDGKVFCWGASFPPSGPTEISSGGVSFRDIVPMGVSNFLALGSDNQLYYWSNSNINVFPISMGPNPVELFIGGASFCAKQLDGKVYCFGDNSSGQLGLDPVTNSNLSTPLEVPAFENIKSLQIYYSYSCGIFGDANELRCVGDNSAGQLGVDPSIISSSFTLVSTGHTGVTHVFDDPYSASITTFVKNGELFYHGNGAYVTSSLGLAQISQIRRNDVGFYAVVGEEKSLVIYAPSGFSGSFESAFTKAGSIVVDPLFWNL